MSALDDLKDKIIGAAEGTEGTTEVKEENTEDRSAYNCSSCGGEGLVKDERGTDTRCLQCSGTGKV